jgi:hypothetical protein
MPPVNLPPASLRSPAVSAYVLFHDQDRKHRDALERHLAGLIRADLLRLWDRSHLALGSREPPDQVAARHRATADLCLVVVTSRLLASGDLVAELETILRDGQARVVPILVDSADWQSSPLATLPPLPGPGRFVMQAKSPDRAWLQVAQQLKRALVVDAWAKAEPQRVVLRLLLQLLVPYQSLLVPLGLLLLLSGLYLLGDQTLAARSDLLGIADANFDYPAWLRLWTGAQVGPGLLVRFARFCGGKYPEFLVGAGAVALAGLSLLLRGRARRTLLVALALPSLAGAVGLLVVVNVHHVLLAGEGTSVDTPALARSQLGDARFEVASWVSNDSPINDRRRQALAGSYVVAFIALLLLSSRALAARDPAHGRPWVPMGSAAIYALGALLLGAGVPRAYALARWGGVYPVVAELAPDCEPTELAAAVSQDRCQVWDVSAGALPQVVMVSGAQCGPTHGARDFRILRLPPGHATCIVRLGPLEVVFAKG